MNQDGFYSSNVSTGNTGTPRVEEYCIDIEFDVVGTSLGDDDNHKATLTKCICDIVITDADPMTLQINFVSYGALKTHDQLNNRYPYHYHHHHYHHKGD